MRPIDWSPENPGPPFTCAGCKKTFNRGEELCPCMKKVSAQIKESAMKATWKPEGSEKKKSRQKVSDTPEPKETSLRLF